MENLKSYLDGELDIAQKAEVETHLRNDEELQRMVEEFSAISSTLKTADSGEPYGLEKLEERLSAAPQAAKDDKKKIWRIATYWSASMACIALAAIMFPVFAQPKMAAKKSSSMAFNKYQSTQSGGGADSMPSREMLSDSTKAAATPSTTLPAQMQDKAPAPGDSDRTQLNSGPQAGAAGFGQASGKSESEGQFSQSEANVNGTVAEKPIDPEKQDGFRDGSEVKTAAKSMPAPASTSGVKGSASAPESDFKSSMRAQRDRMNQPIATIGDTPHGIYLERAGQVQVKVDDLMRAVNEATGMVQGYDGFVTSSDLQNQADGGTATMIVRVPTKNFNAALDKLQSMGEVLSVNSNSQDITSETVDHSARMISWADEEDRLVKELAKAKDRNHIMQIRAELRNVRANLESQKAMVNSLTERAKYSTINISFVRGDKAVKAGGTGNWSGDALKGAKDNLSSIGQVLGTIGIYFLVFSPIWLPFAIAAYVISKKNK